MGLGKEPYRHIYPADLTALRSVSPLAERAYLHLAFGERSSACCVTSVDPEWLRYSLRARRTSEVLDALAELEAAGWLVWDREALQGWLPVQAKRSWSDSETSATGWRNDLERFKPSLAKSQARAFIDSAPIAPSKGKRSATHLSSSNRISTSTSSETPIGVPAVAAAPVASDVDGHSQQASHNAHSANANGPRTAASLFDDHTPASDTNRQPRAKRARTVAESPPSREATRTFFERAGSSWAEADQCYDHHLARGWVSGRTPLKDWDAACRTWIANAKKYASQRGSYRSTKPVYDEAAVWTPEAKARAERESTGAF